MTTFNVPQLIINLYYRFMVRHSFLPWDYMFRHSHIDLCFDFCFYHKQPSLSTLIYSTFDIRHSTFDSLVPTPDPQTILDPTLACGWGTERDQHSTFITWWSWGQMMSLQMRRPLCHCILDFVLKMEGECHCPFCMPNIPLLTSSLGDITKSWRIWIIVYVLIIV